jgi:hypothetical protein
MESGAASGEEEVRARRREIVVGMLEGRINRRDTAHYFDEDIPWMVVGSVERDDLEWLFEQLEASRYPYDGKLEVVVQMRAHWERCRQVLGFEGTREEFTLHTIERLDPLDS